ncbi:pyridoxamine 5'-phosphate oxidase-domain-containing protein [Pterulicium gracile]|uniref:Pyridoxamine 5'-phosphate oxidase-domain-containing protein n=1 Tax=Pterulicium gracile TaxID=1884261 RepID=A0A5C3QW82_9AGAR|nr:pyridoxamine 5'-phosphate oxidase-domain-containing protein [Pterula gracilis]
MLPRLERVVEHFVSNDNTQRTKGRMAGPRWKQVIEKALEKNGKENVFQLATHSSTSPFPQVRCLIFRAFLQTPSNPSNPLLITTTDVRTPKAREMVENPWVQLVWWHDDTKEQYRISGWAGVVPAPGHALEKAFKEAIEGKGGAEAGVVKGRGSAVRDGGLRKVGVGEGGHDWESYRREVFSTMSGHMKATWARPQAPSGDLDGEYELMKGWPERIGEGKEGEDKEFYEKALGNFGLVVVDPIEVEVVELGVVPNRRRKFVLRGEDEWDVVEVVP